MSWCFRLERLAWATLALAIAGCAAPRDPMLQRVPEDSALLHGCAVYNTELRVAVIDGNSREAENPVAPVALAPGIHMIGITLTSGASHLRTGFGLLEDIEVTVQAGHRYVVAKEWWPTPNGEYALDLWVEESNTQTKITEVITVWPHSAN